MKIKIFATPPGTAPEKIREQWIGVEIRLIGIENKSKPLGFRSGIENLGGYQVLPKDAVEALKKSGKIEAANFWSSYLDAKNFTFRRDVCELVNDDGSPLTFTQKFFDKWYSMPDDQKQVIQFHMIPKNHLLCGLSHNRLDFKRRKYSSIDDLVNRLHYGEECEILFSPKKIMLYLQIEDLYFAGVAKYIEDIAEIKGNQVEKFIKSWAKIFSDLGLKINCKIVYDEVNHKRGKYRFQKIEGTIKQI